MERSGNHTRRGDARSYPPAFEYSTEVQYIRNIVTVFWYVIIPCFFCFVLSQYNCGDIVPKRRDIMAKIGYIRVSTRDQHLERQEIALNEIGMDRIFAEKISGVSSKRPEFEAMIQYVREGDILYIESISRLARSTRDLLSIIDKLQEKSVEFVSLKENFDTSTPQGKLILTIFSALSEFERESMLQRQREGLAAAKARGQKFGKPKIQLPKNWDEVIKKWEKKQITAVQAMRLTGLNRGTFYRRYNEQKQFEK